MKKAPDLTARTLHIILIIGLVLITLGIGVGFYFAHEKLTGFATDVSHSVADADASSHSLQRLQNTEHSLKENQKVINDVKNIVATAESYKYQDQIIKDINKYADKSGVIVTQYTFDNAAGASTSSPSSSTAKTETPTTSGASTASGGIKTASVSVAVKSPASYKSLLKFIKYIENNLTNMQLASISLSGDEGSNNVTTDTFNIEVHIK